MDKPFSQACFNNRGPITEVLQRVFAHSSNILEIGSGTGQHAVWFANKMPHLHWQTSDRRSNHAGINQWISQYPATNLVEPVALDVLTDIWPSSTYDGIYSANTAHIMPWEAVVAMFAGIGEHLLSKGLFCLYGPMKYRGVLDAASNIQFDQMLRQQLPHQGIREFTEVNRLAAAAGLMFREDKAMPANNRLLVWRKR
tara:strand:+ start:113 stop:706 length:594 start_codon:yes stop_codon:yes gene_type:complete